VGYPNFFLTCAAYALITNDETNTLVVSEFTKKYCDLATLEMTLKRETSKKCNQLAIEVSAQEIRLL
jgi:hypothetical protein